MQISVIYFCSQYHVDEIDCMYVDYMKFAYMHTSIIITNSILQEQYTLYMEIMVRKHCHFKKNITKCNSDYVLGLCLKRAHNITCEIYHWHLNDRKHLSTYIIKRFHIIKMQQQKTVPTVSMFISYEIFSCFHEIFMKSLDLRQ